MNEEIKFRAWGAREPIKTNKPMMLYDIGIRNFTSLNEFFRDRNLVFMQYTGLKDKNDKELYYGDIVKLKGCDYFFEVKKDDFDIPCFEANAYNDKEYLLIDFLNFFGEFKGNDFEIIGNIYENEELLLSLKKQLVKSKK